MKIYSVTQLREELNELLGQVTVAVQGEIKELHITQNRFVWFSLVDEHTTVKCFMLTFQLKQNIEDGMEIRAVGSPTLFKKGQFVFRPRQIEIVGAGGLQQEYDRLKQQLEKEGLFDESRKRTLPRFPEKIALVTSPDAAAYTDVLRILHNRWSGLEILHAPVSVQGAGAVKSIVGALQQLNTDHPDVDCIILTRGGGSLEDLHAFNDEAVVRAVFASQIPVVAGVGHERDITLTDLAADVRASTPSNAAERVVPDKQDVGEQLVYMQSHASTALDRLLALHRTSVADAVRVLEHAASSFFYGAQELQQRLFVAGSVLQQACRTQQDRVVQLEQHMRSLNPTTILRRGYSIVRSTTGAVVKKKSAVRAGQELSIQVSDGTITTHVKNK